jgi:hypothetical protein
MPARCHWVEDLRCPQCGKLGQAQLSTEDWYSWAVRADSTPVGFKFVRSGDTNNFHCTLCARPVEP